MKNYTITVNGTPYNVTVDEATGTAPVAAAPVAAAAPAAPAAPAPAPVAAAPAAEAAPAVGSGTPVVSPMPGTVLDIKVTNGAAVKMNDVVVVLEAMKMENDIVAPADGVVTSIVVNKGDSVNVGDVFLTIG